MNGRRKRKPFDKKHLVDGHTCKSAQQKTAQMLALDALLFPRKKPGRPEKQQADAHPQNIECKGLYYSRRYGFNKAEVGRKKNVGANYRQVCFCIRFHNSGQR